MNNSKILGKLVLGPDVRDLLTNARSLVYGSSIKDVEQLACGSPENKEWLVSYRLPDGKMVDEAHVVRIKNGISANYFETYMRRRDPDCMFVADDKPTDKPLFEEQFGYPFGGLRDKTFEWMKSQDLAFFAFNMGQTKAGGYALAICPANAGFFAFGLALLQGVVDLEAVEEEKVKPVLIIYVAPPFRHTHFKGKQVVVHYRTDAYEIFSYNLYPGPSAKKGVYGALINQGVYENWVAAHCSATQVYTPYDNITTFMHEGASGGGKSEFLQQPHRMPDGRLRLGVNTQTGEERFIEISRTCDLHPVCDDIGLCRPEFQKNDGRLWLMDGENAWFVRVNHITEYGTDHELEKLTIRPPDDLLFLNIDAKQGSTALIWEHIQDSPNKPCPNPRVILPRRIVSNVVNEAVPVDVRSFGVRTPPCTAKKPTYGIIGLFHILPPALAWLWRLVAPRGHDNPSIVDTEGMTSEGVGSYWPFASGRKVDQANLLLQQIKNSPRTRYTLVPNQHIGVWNVGFMPQWLMRDYLARKGTAPFRDDQLIPARCSLLGYALQNIRIEGVSIYHWFLEVDKQPEVGPEAYDKGAEQLKRFFYQQIKQFQSPDLDSLGKEIIDYCLKDGNLEGYSKFIESSIDPIM